MKLITTNNVIFKQLQIVAFLAIALFSTINLTAQSAVELKPLKGDALFIGVENPVQVTAPGVASDKIYVASDEVEIEKMEDGVFNIRAKQPGNVTLLVHGEGIQTKTFVLEVKQIPDPMKKQPDPVAVLQLPNGQIKRDGEITATEFMQALGVGFVQDAKFGNNYFEVVSFNVVRVPKVGDPTEAPSKAKLFGDKAKSLVIGAQSGDQFYFEDVMAISPSDAEPRKINSLVFHIK